METNTAGLSVFLVGVYLNGSGTKIKKIEHGCKFALPFDQFSKWIGQAQNFQQKKMVLCLP